jgi:hypothetical protein
VLQFRKWLPRTDTRASADPPKMRVEGVANMLLKARDSGNDATGQNKTVEMKKPPDFGGL